VFRGKKGPEIVTLPQNIYCGDQIKRKPGNRGDKPQPLAGKAEIFFQQTVNAVLKTCKVFLSHVDRRIILKYRGVKKILKKYFLTGPFFQ
jgi:hypothetical protein